MANFVVARAIEQLHASHMEMLYRNWKRAERSCRVSLDSNTYADPEWVLKHARSRLERELQLAELEMEDLLARAQESDRERAAKRTNPRATKRPVSVCVSNNRSLNLPTLKLTRATLTTHFSLKMLHLGTILLL